MGETGAATKLAVHETVCAERTSAPGYLSPIGCKARAVAENDRSLTDDRPQGRGNLDFRISRPFGV